MTRGLLIVLAVAGVLALCAVDDASANCGTCGPKAAKTCSAKKGGCPIEASLAKLTLTDAQKKTIAAAKAKFKATCAKASDCGCSVAAGKMKKSAGQAYKAAVAAALTPDQRKAFTAALAPKSAGAKKSGCGGCPKK